MKKIQMIITFIAVFLIIISCSKEQDHSNKKDIMMKTKLVSVENIRATFDLMDEDEHEKMMDMMNVDMKGIEKIDHFILLTLMNMKDKKLIENASVSLSVTGSDNKIQKKSTHIMSGDGMYHYAAGFQMKEKGDYTVMSETKINNKKYVFETKFVIVQ